MRIAYLDCFSGISGDMFLGAAVDAGVPLDQLASVASALGLDAELAAHRTQRGGLSATKIDVLVHGRADRPADDQPAGVENEKDPLLPTEGRSGAPNSSEDHGTTHSHEHGTSDNTQHSHEHGTSDETQDETQHSHDYHSHEHGTHTHETHAHHHEPAHQAAHSRAPHVHRGLKEIRRIVARAPISAAAQAFALKAFELLAAAESKIHNCDAEEVHFHEVGSEDAIVDIVCAAVAIEAIAADRWYSSALNLGSGTVRCAHGVLPVPAPATAELLRGAPVYSSDIQKELLTPTGAAILRALDVRFEPLPRMTLNATGYGAGARDFPNAANVVRLLIGEALSDQPGASTNPLLPQTGRSGAPQANSARSKNAENAGQGTDEITVLEANLDDMNPQLFSYVQQKLLDAGALDAFGVPVQMKKGRPGIVFTVLAADADAELLARILLTETTTLGVRMRREQRRILMREQVSVESCWGPVRIKLGRLHGEIVNCAPEFEDCRRIAEANGVPLKTVLQEALRAYFEFSRLTGSTAAIESVGGPHPPSVGECGD